MQAIITPTSSMAAYAILDDVEFLQLGKHEQQRLHAAVPKQHANEPITQPIALKINTKSLKIFFCVKRQNGF